MKVSEIPSALTKVWDALEGTNKMRASLFNLLVITPKNPHTEYVRTITHKVLERFPSRVIFITLDSSEDQLDAAVSLTPGAKGGQGAYDVVCDFIEITAGKKNVQKIPFLILPHLLPDLPNYILWNEDPGHDNPLSHALEKWATRIIFDSEVADNLATFARALLEHSRVCEIADLNWARTVNWRELLASTFYSPERLAALQQAQKITITYNAQETTLFCHTKIQALYLQSWLATQLGWNELNRFEIKAEKKPELPPGTVISMDIFTSNATHFAFCRDPQFPNQVKTIICDTEKCEIPTKYIFSKTQSGLSLVNEITHNGTSPHFFKVLEFLSSKGISC